MLFRSGYYCLRGTPLYLATRNKCPVGYYCPGGTASGSSAETRCPRATTTLTGAGQLADCRIEEVDVCDKKGVDPFNVFEDQTYYPKHAYPLLTEGAEMQYFDSTTEKDSTGEVAVLAKVMPLNYSASDPHWRNDTVEVFRTCPDYMVEDGTEGEGEDEVVIIGRNFRDSELLTCRFSACLRASAPATGPVTRYEPRVCTNYGPGVDHTPFTAVSGKQVMTRARFLSETRVSCPAPAYAFAPSVVDNSTCIRDHLTSQVAYVVECTEDDPGYGAETEEVPAGQFEDLNIPAGANARRAKNSGGATISKGSCYTMDEWRYAQVRGDNPYFFPLFNNELERPADDASSEAKARDQSNWEYYQDAQVKNMKFKLVTTLMVDCTKDEIAKNACPRTPDPDAGTKFNPCLVGQVRVDVSNDGRMFSGDKLEANHTILGGDTYDNSGHLNHEFRQSWGLMNYVKRDRFINTTEVATMDRSRCNRTKAREEGPRSREAGWFMLKGLERAVLSFDLRHLPRDMVYDEHFKLAVYVRPSRAKDEWCNDARVRIAAAEKVPSRLPAELPMWFTDPSVSKHQTFNISVFALDDVIFKVEFHILHGLFLPLADFFKNSTTVAITKPSRAFVQEGLKKKNTRKLSPFVSFEERLVDQTYIFEIGRAHV